MSTKVYYIIYIKLYVYYSILYYIIYCIILYYIILYYIIVYYIISYYIILYSCRCVWGVMWGVV